MDEGRTEFLRDTGDDLTIPFTFLERLGDGTRRRDTDQEVSFQQAIEQVQRGEVGRVRDRNREHAIAVVQRDKRMLPHPVHRDGGKGIEIDAIVLQRAVRRPSLFGQHFRQASL